MTRWIFSIAIALLVACGGKPSPANPSPKVVPVVSSDSVWRVGEVAFRKGRWADALKGFEKCLTLVRSDNDNASRAHFFLGEIHLAQGNGILAAREFRRTADDGIVEALAPDALLRTGDAYAELWRRPELDPSFGSTAIATYQEVQSRFPRSEAAVKAKARVSELQERMAFKTYRAGVYYFRLKAYDSSIIYFRDLVATYPRSAAAPAALLKMVQAYRAIGYVEELKETCGYVRKFHAGAPGMADACKDVPAAG